MALLTLVVVAGIAAAGWWRIEQQAPSPPGPVVPPAVSTSTQPTLVHSDRDYYIHVKLIELSETNPDGDSWELRSASAPDPYFRLFWNRTFVYESPVRNDRLIAEWDLLRLDVRDALLRGDVEVASAISAPLIRVREGGILRLEVYDKDATFDDEAGTFDLPIENLREGINTLTPQGPGVERIVIDVIPRDMPLPDLLERASNR